MSAAMDKLATRIGERAGSSARRAFFTVALAALIVHTLGWLAVVAMFLASLAIGIGIALWKEKNNNG